MAEILIDGKQYRVEGGQNLLHICLSLGINLPYFCWHPALGSVGACRQCAIKQFKDKDDTRGRIVMACMTPAEEGMRVSVQDQEARDFRASVIEWLMVNHPHDCPICDEAGQCKLQDYAYDHSRGESRFVEEKNHKDMRVPFGPNVLFDGERCISCSRCIRFASEIARSISIE